MPLVQSLGMLKLRVTSPAFKAVLDDVHEKVRGGTALSDAFASHADLFSGVYTASLLAGERSGSLDTVLRRFVAYSKVLETVRRKTLSALMYPAILVVLAAALVAIIVVKVVPAFAGFYGSFNQELPLITRIIVAISDFVRSNLLFLLVAFAALAAAFWAWIKQPGQRARFDRLILKVPVIGPIAHKFATSQVSRTLAALIGGGIPLVNALDTAATATGNRYLGDELKLVAERVREGRGFAATLLERKVMPDVALKMVEVGESTGALQEMLTSLADFYDEDVETEVGRFVTLIEPMMLVVMGVIIAGVVLALYMPLFQLSSVMGR
jgi:type IV pilus assembly protein PilC